ncbi:Hypothetical predicted protein [Octopus vulgaris]|uniref:Uncharacterized protein n=1 Tax=Octopus vulgaris TaxID=6645 RepID=A0AA36FH14_OCTVU|nr:Hypothetical predicted protein [Octopus vulgaris]
MLLYQPPALYKDALHLLFFYLLFDVMNTPIPENLSCRNLPIAPACLSHVTNTNTTSFSHSICQHVRLLLITLGVSIGLLKMAVVNSVGLYSTIPSFLHFHVAQKHTCVSCLRIYIYIYMYTVCVCV